MDMSPFWSLTTYGVVLLLAGAIAMLLSVVALKLGKGTTPLALVALGSSIAIWCLGHALGTGFSNLHTRMWLAKFQYLGIPFVTIASFLLVLHSTERDRGFRGHHYGLLLLVPVLCSLLAWTNEWHGLIWIRDSFAIRRIQGAPYLMLKHGVFFWIFLAYSYMVLLIGALFLIADALLGTRLRQKQALLLLLGLVVPWSGNGLYIFRIGPFAWLDPTPVCCAFGAFLLVWGFFRFRLFDLIPMARAQVMENLQDGIIVIDVHGRIIDMNQSASKWSGADPQRWIGRLAEQCLPALEVLFEVMDVQSSARREYAHQEGTKTRHTLAQLSALSHAETRAGYLLVLYDITDQKEKEEALRLLATTDPLTTLLNRRTFFEMGKQSFAQAKRYQKPLSAMMLDVDHFKSINDTYGHQTGDVVLQQVGKLFRDLCRQSDILARYGGEEFVLLMPETTITQAQIAAERFIQGVRDLILEREGEPLRLSISAGVATMTEDMLNLDTLLNASDKALYKAKKTGRDRVCTLIENEHQATPAPHPKTASHVKRKSFFRG